MRRDTRPGPGTTELLYIRVPVEVAAAIEQLTALGGASKAETALKLIELGLEAVEGLPHERRPPTGAG